MFWFRKENIFGINSMLLQHCEIELVHNKMEERYVNAKTIPAQGVNSSHTKRILEPEQFPATSNFVQW